MTYRTAKRIRLTAREISTILGVAGDALAEETMSSGQYEDESERLADLAAFESGMDKLRAMLARREAKS